MNTSNTDNKFNPMKEYLNLADHIPSGSHHESGPEYMIHALSFLRSFQRKDTSAVPEYAHRPR